MNWTVKSTKNNRTYSLKLTAVEKNGLLQVEITVPKANPRGVRPIGWHESEIRSMLREKGFKIEECKNSTYITNELANTQKFVYTTKEKTSPKRSTTNRKSKSRSTNRANNTANTQTSVTSVTGITQTEEV
jgi:hypothetical protein